MQDKKASRFPAWGELPLPSKTASYCLSWEGIALLIGKKIEPGQLAQTMLFSAILFDYMNFYLSFIYVFLFLYYTKKQI